MPSSLAFAPVYAAPDVAGRLDSAREVVEHRFLQIGDVLAQAAQGLSVLIESLDRIVARIASPEVSDASASLHDAAAVLRGLPDRHAVRLCVILELKRDGRSLAGDVTDIECTLAYLRAFASSIKITAAGIATAREQFADFGQEICQGVEEGRTRLRSFATALGALLKMFDEAETHERRFGARCNDLLPGTPDDLCASASALQANHERVAGLARDIAARGRAVQAQLGSALAGLQIGDITRQRIEHAAEILADAAAVQGLDADRRRRLDAFVHHLLARQLQSASTEFHQEVDRLGCAMAGLASEADAIIGLCDEALGRRSGDGGVLRRLEGDMARACGLVDDMTRAAGLATALGASAAGGAATLARELEALQRVKTEVQHMAINTALRCARINEAGKPLAVIAAELRQHAGHIETSSLSALGSLDQVTAAAGRLGETQGGAAPDQVGATLAGIMDTMRTLSESVETELEGLAVQGASVVTSLRSAAANLDLKTDIGVVVDEAAQALEESGEAETSRLCDLEETLGALLSHAAARYTMAGEREVHAQVLADLPFVVARSAPLVQGSALMDDGLF